MGSDGTAEANAGSEYQLFRIVKSKYGYRLIPKKYLTRCVQLNAASASENINVVTAVYSGLNHQEWYLIDAGTILDKPDLTVDSLNCLDGVVGQSLDVSAIVKNINSLASASTLKIVISNGSEETFEINEILANDTEDNSFSWTPEAAGTYTITATADSKNDVAEANEDNNTKSITILVVDDCDATDSTVDGATSVEFGNIVTDNTYGKKSKVDIEGHYISYASDIDYFKVDEENLIMTEVQVPDNVTVSIEDEDGNVLASSDTEEDWLKVKSSLNPCYIKVTSNTVGSYTLTINAYTEK